MLDPGPDRGLCGIGASGGLGHRLSLGLAAVDATGQHAISQLCFAGSGAVCGVTPSLAAAIFCGHMAQHALISMCRQSDFTGTNEPIGAIDADMAFIAEHRQSDHR